jgi:actin-related protein
MINAVIIDNGTDSIKCGFAGEGEPSTILPTLIGYPKNQPNVTQKIRIGKEALLDQTLYDLKYPIHQGVIKDWKSMEKIWNYIFDNELGIDPSEYKILLTESVLNSKLNREEMCKIMFETFNVFGLQILNQAYLAILGSGRVNGLVLVFGADSSRIVPIQEGITQTYAIQKYDIGGRDITQYLMELLKERGYFSKKKYSISSNESQIVRDIKEKLCYVALDLQKEKILAEGSSDIEKSYPLVSGKTLRIRSERFLAPEIIFNPSIIKKKFPSLSEVIVDAISKCHTDIREDLYSNIVLSGGSTTFPGFKERLKKEISKVAPGGVNVNIINHPLQKYMTWIGGSILASIRTYGRDLWIYQHEYKKYGPSVIHRGFP